MNWWTAALSHRGAARPSNEDAVCIDHHILPSNTAVPNQFAHRENRHFAMIADGMGGHAAGEVASRLAIEEVLVLADKIFEEVECAAVLQSVNEAIYARMKEDDALEGMGTTIVGVALTRERILTFNVGDSRCYLCDPVGLIQLSSDDSPRGSVSISAQGRSHVLTQALGGFQSRRTIKPHISLAPPLRPNERLILCSDGLTDMLDELRIAEIVQRTSDLVACVKRLNEEAMINGGKDNISIILIGCGTTHIAMGATIHSNQDQTT